MIELATKTTSEMASSSSVTNVDVISAAKAIAYALEENEEAYAVVGGAACALLGSPRITGDVDIVVLQGHTSTARNMLKSKPEYFSVDNRTRHTHFLSQPPVEVEILTPPSLFRGSFNSSTRTMKTQGVKILDPRYLLDAKCNSILGRSSADKKGTDAQDIEFLLKFLARNGVPVNWTEVPNANQQFVKWFSYHYLQNSTQLWEDLKYQIEEEEEQ